MQTTLRRLRLLEKATDHSHESSTESDEEEEKIIDDLFDSSQNFNGKVTLDNISDIFELCKNNYTYEFISVLLYMSLRHFNIT